MVETGRLDVFKHERLDLADWWYHLIWPDVAFFSFVFALRDRCSNCPARLGSFLPVDIRANLPDERKVKMCQAGLGPLATCMGMGGCTHIQI